MDGLATSLVGHDRAVLMDGSAFVTISAEQARALSGTPFTKMTGSGNDFVVFDAREVSRALIESPEVVRAICNRNNGIGADGVVLLEPGATGEPLLLRYFNSDGTLGELCGNATLCSTTFAVAHHLAAPDAVVLDTDAGRVHARVLLGEPQIDLAPVTAVVPQQEGVVLESGESLVGFALAGVPHVVIVTDKLDSVSLQERGRSIRQSATFAPAGTNVNWISALEDGRWAYRTYERGVEGETLACGTGAVAAAILLIEWGLAKAPVRLVTRSGREVEVTFRNRDLAGASGASGAAGAASSTATAASGYSVEPSLRGEGRVVFRGTIAHLSPH